MTSKINIKQIFTDHFKTLKDESTGRTSKLDLLFFFVIPIIPAYFLVHYNYFVTIDKLNVIISTNSIFIGLLFNLLALLYSLYQSPKNQTKFKKELTKEMLANISFEIVILIFSIVFAIFSIIDSLFLSSLFSLITYYLSITCFFTLFMILKRMYQFISHDIENTSV
ncbi:hypothetical protein [Flavobacterium filum]|uniref:hypothetical protein n=1 Tax=Flavobacterium filum TaxID=370974 RepID=UPI0023F1C61A|nr:hypothetical protein [Flavobacterium filum]